MGSYLTKHLRLKFSTSSLAMIGLSGYVLSSCASSATTPAVTNPTNFGVVALSTDDGITPQSTLQLIRENKDLKDIETQNLTELHAICMNSDGSLGVVGADLSSPTRLLFQFKASGEDTASRIVYDGVAQGLSIAYLKDTFLVGGGADDKNLYAKVLDSSGNSKYDVDLGVASTPYGAIQGVAASGEQCIAVGHYMDGVFAAPYTAVLTISEDSVGTFSQTNFHKLTFPTVTQGQITCVAMTTGSGNTSIVGGRDETNNKAIAWFVKTDGTSDAINFTFGDKEITAVAINASGLALIAGNYSSLADPSPVLHLVDAASTATVKNLDFSTSKGKIHSVSLADDGQGIAGGYLVDSGKNIAYAGIIDYSATTPSLTSLNLNFEGSINSVAMNTSNQSIIAGIKADKESYVAIVDENLNVAVLDNLSVANMKIILAAVTGSPLKLSATLGGFQTLGSSAKTTSEAKTLTKPSALDKRSLKSNNLRLANYIDKYAEKNAFYFIPAMVEGDLNSAIESASPARNAFSFFTASNNLFFTSTGVSTHIRQQRSIKQPYATGNKTAGLFSEDDLFASLDAQMKQDDSCVKEALEVNKSQVWVQAIGAFAYQSAQNQTPAFSPASGGFVLSYENRVMHELLVGGGFSYLYTHIHEKKDAGYANINQESLFGYASWDNKWLYADATLLFGWFQTTQKRNIDLKGFDFTSSSSPSGWQLLPHLEVGYNYTKPKCFKTFEFRINPFIMLDYANSWQEGYKEHGSSPFNIKQKSQHGSLLRTELGARFYETFMFKNFSLTIEELGGYINTQVYDTGKVNAYFLGYEGSFVVETLSSAQNLGVAQVSMILNPRNTVYPTTTLFYQGEYGSEYLSNQFTCEFAWRF